MICHSVRLFSLGYALSCQTLVGIIDYITPLEPSLEKKIYIKILSRYDKVSSENSVEVYINSSKLQW